MAKRKAGRVTAVSLIESEQVVQLGAFRRCWLGRPFGG